MKPGSWKPSLRNMPPDESHKWKKMSITTHVISVWFVFVCVVNKLKSSNNVDRVRQAHISFAFKMFLVLTGPLRGQATDTDGGGQATGQITCCPTELRRLHASSQSSNWLPWKFSRKLLGRVEMGNTSSSYSWWSWEDTHQEGLLMANWAQLW